MDDEVFFARFCAQQIPRPEWTHRAHVRVAYLHLRRADSFEVALEKMRTGIRALNTVNGVPNTETEGYHETITVAFLRLVSAMIAHYGPMESSEQFCKTHSQLLDKYVLRLYYTRDRISSTTARAEYVAPDIAPLP